MSDPTHIPNFLSLKTLALAGASRTGRGFGADMLRALQAHGYQVLPVHPEVDVLADLPCARSFDTLAPRPQGAVIALPKPKALEALRQAAEAGITQVWLQQGCDSPEALVFAGAKGLRLVHGQCLFLHLPKAGGFHGFHRGLWKLLGLLPKTPQA